MKFKSRKDIKRWLEQQSQDVVVVFAARAALRCLPVFADLPGLKEPEDTYATDIILPTFRAAIAGLFAGTWPNMRAADAAADAADAANAAADAADAANAASAATTAVATAAADAASAAARAAYVAARAAYADVGAYSADDAAHAAAFAASAAVYSACEEDATRIKDGASVQALANDALWPKAMGGMPDGLHQQWLSLKSALNTRKEDWDVWLNWYQARLDGKPRDGKTEAAFVTALTEKDWQQESKVINAKIKTFLDTFEKKIMDFPVIPKQGIGPNFSIINGLLSFTPASELNGDNTIISRQEAIHPQLQAHSQKFVDLLENDDVPRDTILAAARAYNDLVQRPLLDIQMAQLYGDGLFLRAAINAANNPEHGVNTHPLNSNQNIEAEVLTGLHGPFILASEEGQELIADAERYQLSKKDQDQYKEAEKQLALKLSNEPDVATDEVRQHLNELANIEDEQYHPERIEAYRKSAINNLTIPLVGVAIIGVVTVGVIAPIATGLMAIAASVLGTKVIEKSEIAKQGTKALAHKIDKATIQFVAENEALLRNVAGDRAHMKFIHQALDWIKALKESTDESKDKTKSINE